MGIKNYGLNPVPNLSRCSAKSSLVWLMPPKMFIDAITVSWQAFRMITSSSHDWLECALIGPGLVSA